MNQALAPASAGQQQRALWLTTFAFTVCCVRRPSGFTARF